MLRTVSALVMGSLMGRFYPRLIYKKFIYLTVNQFHNNINTLFNSNLIILFTCVNTFLNKTKLQLFIFIALHVRKKDVFEVFTDEFLKHIPSKNLSKYTL